MERITESKKNTLSSPISPAPSATHSMKCTIPNKMTTKTYHIYLKEECLFKDLNSEEFKVIWGRLYRSYFTQDVTYVEVSPEPEDIDPSY